MPKSTRNAGPGQLRPHSRSSSATRLGANLQFTQKDLQQAKNPDKVKKNAYPHEGHPTKPSFSRANSSQRVQSREQLAKRLAPLHQHHQQPPPKAVNGDAKGFSIAKGGQEEEDDDEDWVSSESGAATPNDKHSGSDTASEAEALDPALLNLNLNNLSKRIPSPPPQEPPRVNTVLPRVPTVRQADFEVMTNKTNRNTSRPTTPMRQPQQVQQQSRQRQQEEEQLLQQQQQYQQQLYQHQQQQRQQWAQQQASGENNPPRRQVNPSMPPPQEPNAGQEARQEHGSEVPESRHSPRPRHMSRPPSMHSTHSRIELRPHPLIRGQSYGNISKPVPLAPLTVVPTAAPPQISTSPPSSVHESARHFLSSSPTSVKTSSGSPASTHHAQVPFPSERRSSFSSTRSVNTIPVHSTIIRETPWAQDRNRTFSTMSASSSSAALSSLSHIPNVTRPPSPQSIVFFPPTNPHANPELIHPLLPTPYLQNHLTVLSRRTPIRESFDRVIRAKNAR
ncbi:hypothetical protein CPC08DRAFT_708500 [Agrocybe pediades]|nr:hypothetical protein CPC08DRAFT_708500 [Agrocybe pediades]